MKIEALNCPNCGATVSTDAAQCVFCNSRLKTMACPACLGAMFLGSRHCTHCGAKAIQPEITTNENLGSCPRCKKKLDLIKIGETALRECEKCEGLWADVETFENLCASRENQAAVLNFTAGKNSEIKNLQVNYVPCPDCRQLMNRNNFARSSGVIIDLCKKHGVWFDARELPRIIEFIRQGGLERARQKEKLHIEEQRNRLRDEQRRLASGKGRIDSCDDHWNTDSSLSIREFVQILFD